MAAYQEKIADQFSRWTRRHRSGAFTIVGGIMCVGILSLVAAFWFNSLASREAAARTFAEQLRRDAVQAKQTSLQQSAYFASQLIADEIDRRWRILEMEANSNELVTLMKTVSASPEDRKAWQPMQAWVDAHFLKHSRATEASSWFVMNADGVHIARTAPDEADPSAPIGKNWSYRNYFHNLRQDFKTNEQAIEAFQNGSAKITEHSKLSAAFISNPSMRLKVAFTAPIREPHAETGEQRTLGVLGMTIEVGKFNVLKDALLVDLNSTWIKEQEYRGLVLQHPDLEKLNINGAAETDVLKPLSPESLEQLQQLRAEQLSKLEAGYPNESSSLLLSNLQDPLKPTESWDSAAGSPVLIRSRPPIQADTGWVVIVPSETRDSLSDSAE